MLAVSLDKSEKQGYNFIIIFYKEKHMKKFFGEFKKFITRGNVVDMAVGVLVGSSFTAIVNGLSNFILKPIINFVLKLILGADSLSNIYTPLGGWVYKDVTDELGNVTKEIDLANSIYIDWGAFINAIINFILIAFVLFCIVKFINKLKEEGAEAKAGKLTKAQKAELKAAGIKTRDKAAVKAYFDKKAEEAKLAAEEAKKAEEEKARLEREANPTAEDLLKKILTVLENK